jgi:hypothetical protein
MSSADVVGLTFSRASPASPIQDNKGALKGRSVVNWQKPLFIALIIIGLAVMSTGLASFGTHQWHWFAGALSKLSLLEASVMIGIGSGFIVLVLAVGIMKLNQKKKEVSLKQEIVPVQSREALLNPMTLVIEEEEIQQQLPSGTFTFVLQVNGNYTIFVKYRSGGFGLRGLDVPGWRLDAIKQIIENEQIRAPLTFFATSPLPE